MLETVMPRGPLIAESAAPRRVPEGTVPLLAFEGDAYDCGRAYGELVQERYPGYDTYLARAPGWRTLGPTARRLFEQRAPHVPEVFRGLEDSLIGIRRLRAGARQGGARGGPRPTRGPAGRGCTSFGVAGSATLDGHPISGQTKDVGYSAAQRFVVLRMRLKDAPTLLILAYPGEVWGLGLWSTGMSLYRTSLYSSGDGSGGLTAEQWGLLALAGASVHEAVELAERHGIAGQGSHLITDGAGAACTVEYNAGGVGAVWAADGIATHANHPEGERTAPYADPAWEPSEALGSRFRSRRLREVLEAERGRLTPQRAMMALADHDRYPQSICRHRVEGKPASETAAAAVAEPTRGRLHVVRSQPCSNWAVTYTT